MANRTMLPIHESESCSVAACAEIVGAKWTVLIVHDLSEGPRRFTELEHSCAGISPRTLAERLRWLESEEIVLRRSYAESPPRVEYELTAKGLTFEQYDEESLKTNEKGIIEGDGVKVAFLRDPDGNTHAFNQS